MNVPGRHVVFIPGKNAKPPPALHHEVLWRCISAGAHWARGIDGDAAKELRALGSHFHMAAWNRLFYGKDADISADLPYVAEMLVAPDKPYVPPLGPWRTRFTRVMYTLGDLMPFLTHAVADENMRRTLVETQRYFADEDGIATRIRQTVKDTLRPLFEAGHEVMLIGHSLGSVIAYDTLWELSWQDGVPWRMDTLLTLGSPLGMFYVRRRLHGRLERGARRYPTNVRHWVNIASVGDLTALDRHLHDDYRAMLKLGLVEDITDYTHGVHALFRTADGPNPHRCYGYFFNPLVARTIIGWLRGEPPLAARPE